jgi:uncharacterized UPF0146 family protein
MLLRANCRGLTDYIAGRYACAAEIGIGRFPDVALALAKRGVRVFATDIERREHLGLKVIIDDITEPRVSLYRETELLYSMRPAPELVPYMRRLAKEIGVELIVKPLASECLWGRLTRYGDSTFYVWRI